MRAAARAGFLACCLGVVLLACHLKWPPSNDRYAEMARGAAALRPYLNADSVLCIQVNDVPEDVYLYLRYSIIPARVQLKLRNTGKVLLLSSKAGIAGAVAKLTATGKDCSLIFRREDATTVLYLYQLPADAR